MSEHYVPKVGDKVRRQQWSAGAMNLTTEQARHVRERHAAGDAVIGLAVAGKERPIMPPPQTMDVTVRRTEFIPPADWLAS